MIVVVILGILATLAGVGYGKYIARARLTEAVAMLAEMSSRETLYYSEFAAYLPLRADAPAAPNESPSGFFPSDPTASTFNSARNPTTIASGASWPQNWRSIGLKPHTSTVYCTYLVNAGASTVAVPAGSYGARLLPTPPVTAWFYGLAVCNQAGASGFPNGSTVLGLSHQTPAIVTFNDGQ